MRTGTAASCGITLYIKRPPMARRRLTRLLKSALGGADSTEGKNRADRVLNLEVTVLRAGYLKGGFCTPVADCGRWQRFETMRASEKLPTQGTLTHRGSKECVTVGSAANLPSASKFKPPIWSLALRTLLPPV